MIEQAMKSIFDHKNSIKCSTGMYSLQKQKKETQLESTVTPSSQPGV
jgi:hypothetical protein